MLNLQSKARQPLDIAATVWMVANKTSFTLFATEEQAQRYVSSFAASVGGGLHISSAPVFGVAAPAQAEPSDKSKLHLAIMNISTDDAASAYQFNDAHARYCYKVGHRDARHAAAELVIANR